MNQTNATLCALYDSSGYQRIDWMLDYFGTCARSPLEQSSFWIGLASIGFWLCANTPCVVNSVPTYTSRQLVENYKKKDASSLAPIFLILWFTGDGLNLIGALMTGQLFTQV
jgi:hypothetical protein